MPDQDTPAPDAQGHTPDYDFACRLRDAVTQYLASIDAWERQHGQSYRLPSRSGQISPDLEAATEAYRTSRASLETLIPRARLLYHRHGIREPFSSLLRVNLGAAAPQSGTRAALGSNERTEVARGLVDLIAACSSIADPPPPRGEPRKPSTLAKILSLFR